MFKYPFQKPELVSGSDLTDFLLANGAGYQARYEIDRTQSYIVYGYEDHLKYEDKVKFCSENKTQGGKTAWVTHTPGGLYMASFRPENPDTEKLTPKVYEDTSREGQREAAKAEKERLKTEKRIYGNARALESKNKLMAALTDIPQTAEQLATAADVGYNTATKMLTKMVDNKTCALMVGVKEGAPGPGRHYKKLGGP